MALTRQRMVQVWAIIRAVTQPRSLHFCVIAFFAASAAAAKGPQTAAAAQVPVEQFTEPFRGKVADLLLQPMVYAQGPVEAFPCRPAVYAWFLDHPHAVALAWRTLGAPCASTHKQADGSFYSTDPRGGELRWVGILNEPGRRIWYAEGTGQPAPLLPVVTVRALLILRYQEVQGRDGRVGIRHQAEVFAQVHEPSAWLSKVCGPALDSPTKKLLAQVQFFFAGMARYLCEHPTRVEVLLKNLPPDELQQITLLLQGEW